MKINKQQKQNVVYWCFSACIRTKGIPRIPCACKIRKKRKKNEKYVKNKSRCKNSKVDGDGLISDG